MKSSERLLSWGVTEQRLNSESSGRLAFSSGLQEWLHWGLQGGLEETNTTNTGKTKSLGNMMANLVKISEQGEREWIVSTLYVPCNSHMMGFYIHYN